MSVAATPEQHEGELRLARLKMWDAQGVPRIEMARRENMTRERIRQLLGNLPERKKRRERRLYVADDAWNECERIAREDFKLVLVSGHHKGQGAINQFLEMIAAGKIVCSWSPEVSGA